MGVVLCGCCGKCLVSPMFAILLSKDNYILNLTRNKYKKIKVGGINYELIAKKLRRQESIWEFVEYENSKIYVRSNISKQKRLQTIIHKSLHAMLHECGLDDYANDEKIAKRHRLNMR
ncbi:hypothetical protein [Leuconostoc gasicomitatum]|uniref:hypothetical protein n=1 Tax=Leuconostoc gasicomitatum TaxID=115778 RepID=UPI001CC44437|nr:hypothetical protein [Leuconostoc gasicomitatum]MBZ5988175.1 hypothetical protein [Leuconostoc gasicomitatum]